MKTVLLLLALVALASSQGTGPERCDPAIAFERPCNHTLRCPDQTFKGVQRCVADAVLPTGFWGLCLCRSACDPMLANAIPCQTVRSCEDQTNNGFKVCLADAASETGGTWAPCMCPNSCVPTVDVRLPCATDGACPDGSTAGFKLCKADGFWTRCFCNNMCDPAVDPPRPCDLAVACPGEIVQGVQVCLTDAAAPTGGMWGVCKCPNVCDTAVDTVQFCPMLDNPDCPDGLGVRVCNSDGTSTVGAWGPCNCACRAGTFRSCPTDIPGMVAPATCVDYAVQFCGIDGLFRPVCDCPPVVCQVGEKRSCDASTVAAPCAFAGITTCSATGQWGPCVCSTQECFEGEIRPCNITAINPGCVSWGKKVCTGANVWGACECTADFCKPGSTRDSCPDSLLDCPRQMQVCTMLALWGECRCLPPPCDTVGTVSSCPEFAACPAEKRCIEAPADSLVAGSLVWSPCFCPNVACDPTAVYPCFNPDSQCFGKQVCGAVDTTFALGPCECPPQGCVPGYVERCEMGSCLGLHTCLDDGTWTPCKCSGEVVCNVDEVRPCMGVSPDASCRTPDGTACPCYGESRCLSTGVFDANCYCRPLTECNPGDVMECIETVPGLDATLVDYKFGRKVCKPEGVWGVCVANSDPTTGQICHPFMVVACETVAACGAFKTCTADGLAWTECKCTDATNWERCYFDSDKPAIRPCIDAAGCKGFQPCLADGVWARECRCLPPPPPIGADDLVYNYDTGAIKQYIRDNFNMSVKFPPNLNFPPGFQFEFTPQIDPATGGYADPFTGPNGYFGTGWSFDLKLKDAGGNVAQFTGDCVQVIYDLRNSTLPRHQKYLVRLFKFDTTEVEWVQATCKGIIKIEINTLTDQATFFTDHMTQFAVFYPTENTNYIEGGTDGGSDGSSADGTTEGSSAAVTLKVGIVSLVMVVLAMLF